MILPININDLLNAKTIESERIEFKEGWNPDEFRSFFEVEFFIHPYFKTKNQEKSKAIFTLPIELPELNTIQDINNLLDYLIGNGSGVFDDIAGDIAGDTDGDTDCDIDSDIDSDIAGVEDGVEDEDIAGNQAENQAENYTATLEKLISSKVIDILDYCSVERKKEEIFTFFKIKKSSKNFKNHIKPIILLGWIALTKPDKPSSPNQKYLTTPKGKLLLKLLKI